MSSEEIDRLQYELESLRQENQKLKTTVAQPTGGRPPEPEAPAVPDPVFKGLLQQYQRLKEVNARLQGLFAQYDEAERALAALLPALEIEFKGQSSEIAQLQQSLVETDQTYAEVVARLEQQLKAVRQENESREARLREDYTHQLQALKQRMQELEAPQRQTAGPVARPEAEPKVFTPFRIL
ncbi:MAG: hypothetical protein D6722_12615 [Bacteroidetes bacterium]|nr:MAG: hypothetical protein D6722_12615 [Bacteroidota bacterium]